MHLNSQKTIKDPIELEGVGLHNGIKVNLCLKPAEANSGIKFKRTDIDFTKNIIEASYKNVSSPVLCTKIKKIAENNNEDEKDLEKNFTSCLGGLKIIKDGWETEAIPEKVDKNAKKISFLAKIFRSN